MITSNKNNIGVSAEFDSGKFMHFDIISTKNPSSYCMTDTNLKEVENLSFTDFHGLEIMIFDSVYRFLEMKHREVQFSQMSEQEKENPIYKDEEVYIGVSAEFDSGTFMYFSVFSTKYPDSYSSSDTNIQSVENLTFEDFDSLEIIIADTTSSFLDIIKEQREIKKVTVED